MKNGPYSTKRRDFSGKSGIECQPPGRASDPFIERLRAPRVDKQFAFAVILIILGFGLTQAGGEDEPFLAGLGFGLVVMASVWIAVRIVHDYRGR